MKIKRDDFIVIILGTIFFIILILFVIPSETEQTSLGLAAIQNASDTGFATCTDFDQDNYKADSCGGNDCNDLNKRINPDAEEECNNLDDNCNGEIDEIFDYDSDGFTSCNGDCNDEDFQINPDALELCDKIDNNCNGEVDEGCIATSCTDNDLDGFYMEPPSSGCGPMDCNDNDPEINPASPEICTDYFDNDCDGLVDYNDNECIVTGCIDNDSDGYASVECGGIDCDDANPKVNPGMREVCDNAIDDNCDGLTDLEEGICR